MKGLGLKSIFAFPVIRDTFSLFRRPVGSLRSYDGNCKENVWLKLNFALSQVSCDYSMLITLYRIGGVHFG